SGATAAGVIPVGPPTYQSLLLPYLALSDPTAALSEYKKNIAAISPLNPLNLIDNNAFNIHWIEVLQQYGRVDASVTAATTSYAVLNKAEKPPDPPRRTFVAYNPGGVEETVHFRDSNGNPLLTVTVKPHTTGVFDAAGKSLVEQTDPDYSLPSPQN